MGPSVASYERNILEGGNFDKGLSEAFMVLISKVDNPTYITQFCPISLWNVVLNLVTKTLVNRVNSILKEVILPTQCSFVPGCQISDNIIKCQEVSTH